MSRAQLIETLERIESEVIDVGEVAEAVSDQRGRETEPIGPIQEVTDRERIEYALRESEQRFRDFAATASDWYWETDAGHKFTFISDGYERSTGQSADLIIGRTRFELATGASKDEAWTSHRKDLEARRTFRNLEYSVEGPDGTANHFSVSGRPFYSQDSAFLGYRGTGSNITERKLTQEALRDSEERYRRLVELSPDGVLVNQDGRIAFVNPAAVAALGADSAEQVLGIRALDVLHPDFRSRSEARVAKVLADERVAPMDQRYLRFDGGSVDIEATATPIHYEGRPAILSIFRDISERKRAEQALRESEARETEARAQLSEAIETLSEGFAWYDEEDRLVLFNSTYVEIYDKSRDLFVPGARFEDIIRAGAKRGQYPDAVGRVDEWVAERMARHRDPSGPFHQRLHNNRWVQISERRLPGGGTVGIRTDITWPKEMEQELRRKERLAALGQLTGTVSHELRNPLGTLQVAVASIKKLVDTGDNPVLLCSIELVERSVKRCNNIISELLDFARFADLALHPTAVDPWLMSVIAEFDVPQGLKLNCELGCNCEVVLDQDRMRRVMINLLDNACHAMSDQEGNIPTDAGHELTVRAQTDDNELKITIADTGHGIANGEMSRIFEPLFSTKAFGVGLGLSIVKQVLEQHGGSVEIDSAEGSGTVVLLLLPIHAAGGTGMTAARGPVTAPAAAW